MIKILRILITVSFLFGFNLANAQTNNYLNDLYSIELVAGKLDLKELNIIENHKFYGLSSYLNAYQFFVFDDDKLKEIKPSKEDISIKDKLVVISGRYNALVIENASLEISENLNNIYLNNNVNGYLAENNNIVESSVRLSGNTYDLKDIKYSHLVYPMAKLTSLLEKLLIGIKNITNLSWGISLVLFALIVKALLFPASLYTLRLQEKATYYQSKLNPQIQHIKQSYKGEQAHNKIMAAHKDLGITPFYSLKPSIGFFIQIPVFIAIFNLLAELPQLQQTSFLWMKDLSQPDAIFNFGFLIPWFGNTFNLVPVLMAVVAIIAAMTYKLQSASQDVLKKKQKSLILMGIVFLLLFYPFPAAMTFYWLLANVFQLLEQNIRNYYK